MQKRDWNSCAIIGFVLSLIPLTCGVGFILGLVGVAQCTKREERGRGLAVAAVLINAIWFALAVLSVYYLAVNLQEVLNWLEGAQEGFSYGYAMVQMSL